MLLSARVSRHLPTVLLWAGMAACVAGLVAHRLWQALPFPRFFEHVLLAGLALLAEERGGVGGGSARGVLGAVGIGGCAGNGA